MTAIKLIIGLQNPGPRYAKTRHNLGAKWVLRLCAKFNAQFQSNSKLQAQISIINYKDSAIICILPEVFMNLSGSVVLKSCQFYKCSPDSILIIHDELDLEPGNIRLKSFGGHGGHNGLRDIINEIKDNNFKRLRLGIGHPGIKHQVADYVLNPATLEEQISIDNAIDNSIAIFPDLITGNWQSIMQFLHK